MYSIYIVKVLSWSYCTWFNCEWILKKDINPFNERPFQWLVLLKHIQYYRRKMDWELHFILILTEISSNVKILIYSTTLNNVLFCFLKLWKERKETRELLVFQDHQVKLTTLAVSRHSGPMADGNNKAVSASVNFPWLKYPDLLAWYHYQIIVKYIVYLMHLLQYSLIFTQVFPLT